jgi:hypothetical protein
MQGPNGSSYSCRKPTINACTTVEERRFQRRVSVHNNSGFGLSGPVLLAGATLDPIQPAPCSNVEQQKRHPDGPDGLCFLIALTYSALSDRIRIP